MRIGIASPRMPHRDNFNMDGGHSVAQGIVTHHKAARTLNEARTTGLGTLSQSLLRPRKALAQRASG